MPYNQQLAERLRQNLIPLVQTDEKKMFGGVAFLVKGNMLVGVIKDSIIVRGGPNGYERQADERMGHGFGERIRLR